MARGCQRAVRSVIRRGRSGWRGEQVPCGHEQGSDDGADHETGEAEQRHSAQRGDEHHVVGHLRVLAHQNGAQQVVHQPDDADAVGRERDGLPGGACGQEIDGHGAPDQAGAHGGQQRQEGHQNAPHHGSLDVQHPEDQPAQRPLGGGHRDVALDRGTGHGDELARQLPLVLVVHRDRVAHAGGELHAVAQQEEQQVEHHAEAHDELQRVLAHVQRLGRQELAGLGSHRGQPRLQLGHGGEVEAVQQRQQPGGQRRQHLLQVGAVVELPRTHPFVGDAGFLRQGHADEGHRQDHDQQADAQRHEGREVAPARHAPQQLAVQGREQNGEHHAPEHRAVEGPQDGGEGHRHGGEQEQQGAVLECGGRHVRVTEGTAQM